MTVLPDQSAPADELKRLLNQLSDKQLALVEQIILQKGSLYNLFPLSFAQQRLWFLDQLDPNSVHYNIPLVLRLHGSLDVKRLTDAMNQILQRHEVLRTTFCTIHDKPYQQVSLYQPLALTTQDLTHLPQPLIEAQEIVQTAVHTPFNLQTGPLFRLQLLQVRPDEHILIFVSHHIISDGWSTGVFVRELSQLYGTAHPLPPLTIQYGDFSAWQRQWLQEEALEAELAYWRKQMAGAPPLLELPTDKARPTLQSYKGASHTFTLTAELSQKWRTFCQQEKVTPFMGLLALFKVLLYRYSGQADICVGTPMAGRQDETLEPLLGFFVNTVVLRTQLHHRPNFRTLLQQVRQTALDGYSHQDLPFEKLVEELKIERSLSHSPLFQVLFALQNVPADGHPLPDLRLDLFDVATQTAQFDLSLMMSDGEQLSGTFIYNTDLFMPATIERMAAHWQRLLTAVLQAPNQPIDQLPMLSLAEKAEQKAWNETAVSYPQTHLLPQLLTKQAQETPEQTAVTYQQQTRTYQQFEQKTNQLAHVLQTMGVGAEVRVGICMERSVEMVQSIWAILKAGGAYVPIDPTYPPERIQYMLNDAQPSLLLVQSADQADLYKAQFTGQIVDLSKQTDRIIQAPTTPPPNPATLDNLAYIIYTSGSTGKPKGAMNSHRAILNRILWMQETYQLNSTDTVMQKTPFSFDVSVWEFLWPLVVGAHLLVAKPDGHKDNAYLLDLINQHNVTTLHFVPSMLQLFVEEPHLTDKATSLRRVICSGEALPTPLQDRFLSQLEAELHNLYGPTEAAIDVTYWHCQPSTDPIVPIGRPIANLQIHLLSSALEPVPVGVTGELYIGGTGLARGYHQRPLLTADRFIPHPYQTGERLYRTGDLARYRPDGAIEFLGRVDSQIKLRGFRIELGEIEAVLAAHPDVREVVLLARTDRPNDTQLVAYVVATTDALTNKQLREFLASKLPEYMIPATFIFLELLPLLPNGKVNRHALPAPDMNRPELQTDYVAPRSAQEEQLAHILRTILRVERVGIHDDFFELGGHSLLAIQYINQINRQHHASLPLRAIFENPTIARLSEALIAHLTKQSDDNELEEQGIVTVPLTPGQHFFFGQDHLNPNHSNVTKLMEVPFPLNEELMRQTLDHLAQRHDVFGLRFTEDGNDWQQTGGHDRFIPLHVHDFSARLKEEQEGVFTATAVSYQQSLDLQQGPLCIVGIFRFGEDQPNRLLFIIHHLLVDGISVEVLFQDLQLAYFQLVQGQAVQLPPKTTSFREWSQRLFDFSKTDTLRQELPYWLDEARRHKDVFPRDHDLGEDTMASGNHVTVALPQTESQAILHLIREQDGEQLNNRLLVALSYTLLQWGPLPSLLLDVVTHGRDEIFDDVNLARTVGWLSLGFPMFFHHPQTNHIVDAYRQMVGQLTAVPNAGTGYSLLHLDRKISATLQEMPRPRILYNYLGESNEPEEPQEPEAEKTGDEHNPEQIRPYLFHINARVRQEKIELEWHFSQNYHTAETIKQLAKRSLQMLHDMSHQKQTPVTTGTIL